MVLEHTVPEASRTANLSEALFFFTSNCFEDAVLEAHEAAANAGGDLDAARDALAARVNDAPRAFHDLDAASWDRMIRVNLSSVFVCMKHELRHMAAAGSGAIVNTSSGAGVVAAPGLPHYTAAKHGVVGLTKAAAQEYVRQGIRVNAVLPGSTDTTMLQSFIAGDEGMAKIIASSNIHGRLIEPDEIASAVGWLAAPHAGMVNGQALIVDGGGLVR